MLASLPLLLAPGKLCPSSMYPRFMCVHAKAKITNQQTNNGKKKVQRAYGRGIKLANVIGMASIETRMRVNKRESKQISERENKKESKQKEVSMRDKCRFGSGVYSFIVLKYERHTSK